MTRLIAGRAGGRRLAVPASGTRPTSDRVREALFSALEHDPGLDGAAVLDVCAGSGALGLEALSRGAADAVFVESDRRAAGVLRRNLATVGLGGRVIAAGAGTALGGPAPRPFDVMFLDPPYAVGDAEIADWLTRAAANGWLAPDATVVVERAKAAGGFGWPDGLEPGRSRRYGDTMLHRAHYTGA
ncbi:MULTISPECIES: 16S rRNA (guanine(966)-N(2))-methyltransferase RsmD [Pseudonocardia]|uniref:Ribosomal RNA small subunit methyltransferase D n=2 Tax=Pseudonocardia TaxID=1847 RepID=A0A1Y2N1T5_PSEAH|nr:MULTISPECIES: 16S rRNA (guanine(966)-N(2))-methyltransferase RsmD [Pseudonocardia]OSY41171.1 Ribosomal RNA small subunit methyltransferase D [Pseudonocardia autotrophica]TDN76627.1 16S rRNA (guanine966-N2)-methyltransferase [Pseudonocardia autotrophica]BBG00627.1 methyltransferase [Pseudonocardia autotrophica]GEC28019.1 methyltransferase [Pseudonocardia saturnea]